MVDWWNVCSSLRLYECRPPCLSSRVLLAWRTAVSTFGPCLYLQRLKITALLHCIVGMLHSRTRWISFACFYFLAQRLAAYRTFYDSMRKTDGAPWKKITKYRLYEAYFDNAFKCNAVLASEACELWHTWLYWNVTNKCNCENYRPENSEKLIKSIVTNEVFRLFFSSVD